MARGAQWVGCPTPPLWVTGNAWRQQLTVVSQPGHSGFQTFLRPFQMLWKVREELHGGILQGAEKRMK